MSAPGHLRSESRLMLDSFTAGHLGVILVRRGPVRRVPRPSLPCLPWVLSAAGHLGSCEPRLLRASFAAVSSAVALSAIALSAVDLFCRAALLAVGLVHRKPSWSEPCPPWATSAASPVCCGRLSLDAFSATSLTPRTGAPRRNGRDGAWRNGALRGKRRRWSATEHGGTRQKDGVWQNEAWWGKWGGRAWWCKRCRHRSPLLLV